MDNPTRLAQLRFALALMGFGLLSLLFTLASVRVRAEYRDMIKHIFNLEWRGMDKKLS